MNKNIFTFIAEKYWSEKVHFKDSYSASLENNIRTTNFTKIKNGDSNYFNHVTHDNILSKYTVLISLYSLLLEKYFHDFEGGVFSYDFRPIGNNHPVLFNFSIDRKESFKTHLNGVKDEVQESLAYSDYSVTKLKKKLKGKNLNEFSRFGILFTENNGQKTKNNGVLLKINLSSQGFYFNFDYDKSFIQSYVIDHLQKTFKDMLLNLHSILDKSFSEIDILDDTEKRQVLFGFNNTMVDFTDYKTIVDLFEEQVEKSPENTAVIFGDCQLTYRELNSKANRLAHYLKGKCEIQPGAVVSILLPKSNETLICILAILKTGASFLPIDLNYPKERIEFILKDSNSAAVISKEKSFGIQIDNNRLILIDKIRLDEESHGNPNISISPADMAYVIYTSGSTGNPKGVMVEHSSNVNMSLYQIQKFDVSTLDRIAWFASISFDASVSEIMMALFSGATLAIPQGNVIKNKIEFISFLKSMEVSIVTFPPSYLELLMPEEYSSLRCIITAGEAANPYKAKEVIQSNIRYFNAYGPTECAVCVSIYEVNGKNRECQSISIGKPIANMSIYILDEDLRPVPIGVQGKMYVSGIGVARGYLNNPKLTKSKFISNPFITGERMYDTGDLGRWLPDSNVEFLGRIDQQVKIRGYRIELGEIEANIYNYSKDLIQVVVDTKTVNEQKVLVAYYVTNVRIDKRLLKHHLQKKLPDYMVPSFFVVLNNIPLTLNGKVKYGALPDVDKKDIIRSDFEVPENQMQKELAALWRDILGVNEIGLNDNFFELGGHSLNLMELRNRIESVFNKRIDFVTLYNKSNLREQCESIIKIPKSSSGDYKILNDSKLTNLVPPFPGQERLYSLSKGNSFYYIRKAFRIYQEPDVDLIKKVMFVLINRHETLRSNFVVIKEKLFLRISENKECLPEYYDLRSLQYETKKAKESQYLNEEISPFDLENDLLLKVRIIHTYDHEFVLFFIIDHIITDGWGVNIFFQDFYEIYKAIQNGDTSLASVRKIKYGYREILERKRILRQKNYNRDKLYWLHKFVDGGSNFRLSYDFSKEDMSFVSATINHQLNFKDSKKIIDFADKHNISYLMTYLSIVNYSLSKQTNQGDITTGIVMADRDELFSVDEIGFQLSTLPIRTRINLNGSFEENFPKVKNAYLEAIKHKDFPFVDLVKHYNKEISIMDLPYYKIFVFEGQKVLETQKRKTLEIIELLKQPEFDEVSLENSIKYSIYELMFMIEKSASDVISLSIVYNKSLFKCERIQIIMDNLISIITNEIGNTEYE